VCVSAHSIERLVIEVANGNGGDGELVIAAAREFGRVIGVAMDGLNDGVCEETAGDLFEGLGIEVFEFVADAGADRGVSAEEGMDGVFDGLGGGVHNAGEGMNLDDLRGYAVGILSGLAFGGI